MSAEVGAYRHDPRVKPYGDHGFEVTRDGQIFCILYSGTYRWTISTGHNLSYVSISGYGLAIGFDTADDAIGALIGDARMSEECTRPERKPETG